MKKLTSLIFAALLLNSSAFADFPAGLQAYDKGNFAVALKEWQPLADGGDARAQLRLGLMNAYGKGLKNNPEEAEKLFLKAALGKANLNEADKQGHTALTWAARRKTPVLIEALLAGGADINLGDNDQKTPLMVAVDSGQVEIISLLLKNGADPKKSDKEGKTAMHFAVERGDPARIELLLSKGAKLDTVERHGWTPLMLLLDSSPEETTLNLVRLLVNKGASIRVTDKTKQGPLHLLAKHADEAAALNLVDFFLEKGAEVNAADEKGQTPLRLALERISADSTPLPFVQALLNKGADLNARDKYQETPVFFVIRPDFADKAIPLLEALLVKGADLNAANEKGLTPLHLCMYRPGETGSEAFVKFLLAKGVNVNAKSREGRTPLHLLAEAGEGAGIGLIGKLLLGKKADPNIQEKAFGRTPLHVAASKGNAGLVKALLAAGARTDIKDNHKDLARDLAEENGGKDLAILIRDSAPGSAIPTAPTGVLDKAGQQKRAEELLAYLGKLKDNDRDLIEKAYKEILEKCPESDKVPEALWRLSNLYLDGSDKPDFDQCVKALETLNAEYAQFMNINPLTNRKEAITPVQKRLTYCYEKLGSWKKAADIYRIAFAKPESMGPGEFIAYGVLFGLALEKSEKKDEAILVYGKTLKFGQEKASQFPSDDIVVSSNLRLCKEALARLKSAR